MAPTVNVEVRAQVDDAIRGLAKVNGSLADMAKRANQDAAGALGVFGVSLTALNNPLTLVAGGIKSSIDMTINWADEMDKLARNTGMTTEEASKLAIVAGDFGIQSGTLEVALKSLTKNGIALNAQTLSRLAREYQAIEDPVERMQFATENFGRAAQDMTEILSQTPEKLDEMGRAAARSGKIMSEESVEAAQEFKIELKQLNDQLDGFKIAAGRPLIKVLSDAATTWDQFAMSLKLVGVEARVSRGEITRQQAILETQLIINKGLTDAQLLLDHARQDGVNGLERYVKLEKALTGAYDDQIDVAIKLGKATDLYGASLASIFDEKAAIAAGLSGQLARAQDDYLSVIKETTPEIDKLTAQIEKYKRSQGQTITVVEEATTSANEYELATLKAAAAQLKLAEATDVDALELAQLKVNADHAQESVVKLGEGFGFSRDFTLDYTRKIQEANGSLDELNAKQAAAEEQLRKTTAQFVIQATAGALQGDALLEFTRATGLLSEADYTLIKQVQFLTDIYDKNNDGVVTADENAKGYTASLETLAERTAANTVKSAESQPVIGETTRVMQEGRGAAEDYAEALLNIPTNIKINVETIYSQTGGPGYTSGTGTSGGGGYGGGNDWPGGGNGGTQPPPITTQSRGNSGVTINQYIHTTIPATDSSLLQTARAVSGAW